ncbi:MAG: enoyl-CoA hydratase/isomerase family protein [Salinirussus sp.]
MSDDVIIDRDDGWATLTLNRPSKVNALTGEMFAAIGTAVESVDTVDGITIRGAEGHFSAGVDMSGVPEWAETRPLEVRDELEAIHEVLRKIEAVDVPVIAAVEGAVLGGALELAITADLRIAAESAEFGLPEAEMGLAMDLGGAQKLPRYIGEGLTKYLIMTGETIDAHRARDAGLVETVYPSSEFDDALSDLEATLAEKPAYVHGLAKRQVHAARPPMEEGMQLAIHHAIAAYREEETQSRVSRFLAE